MKTCPAKKPAKSLSGVSMAPAAGGDRVPAPTVRHRTKTTAARREQMRAYYQANRARIQAHRRRQWAAMPGDQRAAQLVRLRANVKAWERRMHERMGR